MLKFASTLTGVKVKNDDGNTVVTIKKESVFSPTKLISTNNEILYHTSIIDFEAAKDSWNRAANRKYILYDKSDPYISADLIFAKDAGHLGRINPPQVERLILKTPFGEWEAERQTDYSVLITDCSKVIGKITPFYKIAPQIFACSDEYPAAMWAGVYVLVDYMMHEDELISV
jgi:hypothetical protein